MESLRNIRSGIGLFALLILLVPYCVDLAWYGDFTPTHYSQENINEGKSSSSRTSTVPILVEHLAIVFEQPLLPRTLIKTQLTAASWSWSDHLSESSFISRPPPVR